MALADIFKQNANKSITVTGAESSNISHATYSVKCNNIQRNCYLVNQLERANLQEGAHVAGGKTVTVATAHNGNCYWLPWRGWRAVVGQLQGACNFFVTANLTGCCFVVSGNPVSPFVVHMNCQPANENLVNFPNSGDIKEYNFDLQAAQDQFYGQVTEQLITNNVISHAGLQMLKPSDYGAKAREGYASPTSVFGVRTGGLWTIYYNVGKGGGPGITRELFPNFQPL
ncbi:hypothetical protein O5O45_21970 [Hahella aquimaris]|uniref:hypothetical protein n=1 Tax=Hahella sp. HNIBRBA332 TaxID=3015983 RepID=UPI00273AB3CC|nr:hypothetical protein [Hahella sp. HNIBRBA332]WLQ12398.1 hypothetical protein O5O45_21970 [Hahella sp. HNIBRBA332]